MAMMQDGKRLKRFAGMISRNGFDVQIALITGQIWILMIILWNSADKPFVIKSSEIHIHICLLLWRMQSVQKIFSYENDVLQFIHEVLEELTKRTSPVERDLYIRQLSTETNISVEAITQQFMKMAGNRARQAKAEPVDFANNGNITEKTVPKRKKTGTERAERLLLYHLLNDGSLFDRFQEERQRSFYWRRLFSNIRSSCRIL